MTRTSMPLLTPKAMPRKKRLQGGAALLLAMIILTLVSTLAAGMVWQQSRAVQLEAAERARVQSAWILTGALDWARLILREDGRPSGSGGNAAQVDHLGEPWAVPLAEARLSSFLAADKDNNADSDLEAFLSGSITDAQARYNLRNLFAEDGKPKEAEVRTLERLCESAGLSDDVASRLVEGLRLAWSPVAVEGINDLPLAPLRLTELSWVGIDSASIAKLAPFVIVLPAPTPVNANTASREVLVAVLDGLDLGTAERLLELRQRSPFANLEEIRAQIGQAIKLEEARVSVGSSFFEVVGRMRLDQFVIEELSLVERRSGDRGAEVVALLRERRPVRATP
jgi:general secretion pathway protein K